MGGTRHQHPERHEDGAVGTASSHPHLNHLVGAAALAAALVGCSDPRDPTVGVGREIVYRADDRREFYEATERALADTMARSLVALVPRAGLTVDQKGIRMQSPSLGQSGGLCPGERFADQPAASFCSGVLVDWDLVLTAGHCVRLLVLDDFAVTFDYHYVAPGTLALDRDDLYAPVKIVSEALDPPGREPRLDYAWIRLDRPVRPPRRPAPVFVAPPALEHEQPIVVFGTPGGVPMKWDDGARVRDARTSTADYFLADADASHGASGGGAFDQNQALLGVLARGGPDLLTTEAGCNVTVRQSDGALASEQFSYAHRAVEGLCRNGGLESSLCRRDCGNPCVALPPPDASGCSVAARGSPFGVISGAGLLLVYVTVCRRARRQRT